MNIAIETVINLLHQTSFATLATHSLEMPGYPFLSVLPFAPDERHCPVFLLSGLAEHTKNLRSDPRVGFLVVQPHEGDVQAGARLTLLGHVAPLTPSDGLVDRYLRYQPSAQRYLRLADFGFFRLQPKAARMIEGFGRMGWVKTQSLLDTAVLSLAEEANLLNWTGTDLPAETTLLGVDPYGIDLEIARTRRRLQFEHAPVAIDAVSAAASSLLKHSLDGSGALIL